MSVDWCWCYEYPKEAADEIERLRAERDALKKDAERLDFMADCVEKTGKTLSANLEWDCFTPAHYTTTVHLFTVPSQHVKGEGLRSAIDKAMEESK